MIRDTTEVLFVVVVLLYTLEAFSGLMMVSSTYYVHPDDSVLRFGSSVLVHDGSASSA